MKTYFDGVKEGIRLYAWWKDGVQYVGTTGTTLKKALEEVDQAEKIFNLKQTKLLEESLDQAARQSF